MDGKLYAPCPMPLTKNKEQRTKNKKRKEDGLLIAEQKAKTTYVTAVTGQPLIFRNGSLYPRHHPLRQLPCQGLGFTSTDFTDAFTTVLASS